MMIPFYLSIMIFKSLLRRLISKEFTSIFFSADKGTFSLGIVRGLSSLLSLELKWDYNANEAQDVTCSTLTIEVSIFSSISKQIAILIYIKN